MAFFDVRKLFNNDGSPKSISDLDDDTAAAISGIDVANVGNSEIGIGQILKLKLADKKGSLELLGKWKSMFVDNVNIKHTFADLSDDDLDAEIARLEGQSNA